MRSSRCGRRHRATIFGASRSMEGVVRMARWAALTMDEVGEAAARRSAGGPAGGRDRAARPSPRHGHRHAARRARRGRRPPSAPATSCCPRSPYGCSLGHTDRWPGTLSLLPATMIAAARGGRPMGARLRLSQARDGQRPRHERAAVPERDPAAAPRAARPAPALRVDLRPHAGDRRALHARTRRLPRERGRDLDAAPPRRRAGPASSGRSTSRTERVGRVLQYAMPAVTRSGVVGTPSTRPAARGAELFGELVDALAALLGAGAGRARPGALTRQRSSGRSPIQ